MGLLKEALLCINFSVGVCVCFLFFDHNFLFISLNQRYYIFFLTELFLLCRLRELRKGLSS
uniref:Uncharacterized protein n=1 Tax=Cannabis sativa TaxID=3483 RepID=A0A803QU69_CANSA